MVGILVGGRIKYVAKPGYVEPVEEKPVVKAKREPKAKAPAARIDPKYLAAARELRDRYLERVNGSTEALPAPNARYDVSRALPAALASPVQAPAPAGAAMRLGARALRRLPSAAA